MHSRSIRSSAETLIVTLMLIVITLGGLGYCFSWSAVQQKNVSFLQSVRSLFNTITCKHDLDPTELDVEELVSKLSLCSDDDERLIIIRQLGKGASYHWASHAVSPLLYVLQNTSNHAEHRSEAVQSLINLASHARSAIPAMLHCLGDEVGEVRQLAVCFLIGQGREMKQPLVQQLNSTDDRRFASAAMALSHYTTVSLQPVASRLEKLSHHHDAVVRAHIAKALGQIHTKSANERLRKLLADSEPGVREEAVISLGQSKLLKGQNIIVILKPAMKDRDACVRQSVVRVISQCQDAGAEKMIENMIDQEMDALVKQSMSRVLDRLIRSRRGH